MNSITVKASKEYQVHIGAGLIRSIGKLATSVASPGKAVIISDSNVWPLYGKAACDSLSGAGFEALHYVFPAGEERKNPQTYLSILHFLAENEITRSDLIIALGGGVVGDMAGFAAATYLRGIKYIQVPTTLLAMVDSSVGGKTAIDLPAGKNLVGAFYQPCLVLCDTCALNTLSPSVFSDGCAEVIKYGVLFDELLFCTLEKLGLDFDREAVITRCIELKRDVVAEDEFDTGLRQKLNLGHTIGHSIEKTSNFNVTHGQAVSMGMAVVARSVSGTVCTQDTADRICNLLEKFSLPVKTLYSAKALHDAALSDKKRFGESINMIVPERIGNCIIQCIPVSSLQSFIEAGL